MAVIAIINDRCTETTIRREADLLDLVLVIPFVVVRRAVRISLAIEAAIFREEEIYIHAAADTLDPPIEIVIGIRRRLAVENTHLDWVLVREGSHVYVEHQDAGEWELYDLARDPHQLESQRDADVTEWSRKARDLFGARGIAMRALEQ